MMWWRWGGGGGWEMAVGGYFLSYCFGCDNLAHRLGRSTFLGGFLDAGQPFALGYCQRTLRPRRNH